jgi:hypothetical protein|tara:strand:- start:463 stop:1068 length:606 start_codon:yes stop_codon:yes gene_type:complete
MKPLSFILALATLSSCASQTIYLSQLRDADTGSQDAQAYNTLQEAVMLANDFLASSPLAKGYPAENAHFGLGLNNIILRLDNEYDLVVSIKRAYWGDLRFVTGEDVQADADGIVVAMGVGGRQSDAASNNAFLKLPAAHMAATVLRQSVVMREIQARGEVDYWLNYTLLGIDTNRDWGDNSHVDKRAALTEQAFYQWHAGL